MNKKDFDKNDKSIFLKKQFYSAVLAGIIFWSFYLVGTKEIKSILKEFGVIIIFILM